MTEGTLTNWLVPEGARVTAGQEIAELESSKIANAIEAPAAGILRRQFATHGEAKSVGSLLAVLSDAGEEDADIDAFAAQFEISVQRAQQMAPPVAAAETIHIGAHTSCFRKVKAGRSAGVPLLMLHGFGADHLNWVLNQEALAANHDVYALDLPGHGGSSKEVGDGSLETLAAGVADWLDAQSLSRVHIIGHSMGAAVAALTALAHPKRVCSLTAVCGAGFGGPLNRTYVEGFLGANRRRDLQPVVEMLFADPLRVTRTLLDELMAYKRIDGVADALRRLIDNALAEDSLESVRSRLCDVTCPAIAFFGSLDKILPPPSRALPFESQIIESAGHMPHIESADLLNSRIGAFIEMHD